MCNIACGNNYINHWINFDYFPHSKFVKKANLLERLPIDNDSANIVYSSHFIEHIPRDLVNGFLEECFRITKSRGVLRLVLPDWEELCSTYLTLRQSGGSQHERADFLMVEMLDQCVRRVSGGELGAYYDMLQAQPNAHHDLIEFIRRRTGHNFHPMVNVKPGSRWLRFINTARKIHSKLERLYIRSVISLLPSAFRQQNVSLAGVGENHAWMYDFHTIKHSLSEAGFIDVQRMSATTSNISDFPFIPLDVNPDGLPRKGKESMYIEAVKL